MFIISNGRNSCVVIGSLQTASQVARAYTNRTGVATVIREVPPQQPTPKHLLN